MIIETIAIVAGVSIVGGAIKYVAGKFCKSRTVNRVVSGAVDVSIYGGLAAAGFAMGYTAALYALAVIVGSVYAISLLTAVGGLLACDGWKSKLKIIGLWLTAPVSLIVAPNAMMHYIVSDEQCVEVEEQVAAA